MALGVRRGQRKPKSCADPPRGVGPIKKLHEARDGHAGLDDTGFRLIVETARGSEERDRNQDEIEQDRRGGGRAEFAKRVQDAPV